MLFRAEILAAVVALPLGFGLIIQNTEDVPPEARVHVAPVADVSFAEEIMPLFEEYCTRCHGNETAELGLNVATYEGAMMGSDYGSVIEAGNVVGSLIVDMVESGDMPPEGDPFPTEALELLKTWIEEGAQNN